MSDQQTPAEIIQQAEQAVTDADAALAALEARVIAGETLDPADIERARTNRHVAELQRDGARKRADEKQAALDAATRKRVLDNAARALDQVPLGAIAERYATAERALRELIDLCETRNVTIRSVHAQLSRHDVDGVEVSDFTHQRAPYVVVNGDRHAAADSTPGALIEYLVKRLANDHHQKLPLPYRGTLGGTVGVRGLRNPPAVASWRP
ncbi:hypothetical protein [Streptomyces sp. MH13]|uniref:hypothetical protein n=1 Tax=Streptomyces sp. MH13 TaxID=3417651 RepID=UPI003CEE0016